MKYLHTHGIKFESCDNFSKDESPRISSKTESSDSNERVNTGSLTFLDFKIFFNSISRFKSICAASNLKEVE